MNTVSAHEQLTTAPRCSRCGREGWKDVFACPERAAGNCLFAEESRQRLITPLAVLIMVILLILAGIGLLSFLQQGSVLALTIALSSLSVIIAGLVATQGMTISLYHPPSGLRLRRTALRGFELNCIQITRPEPLSLDLELPPGLNYPPSIMMLPDDSASVSMNVAVDAVRAALLSLLARQQLQVYGYQFSESKLGRQPTKSSQFLIRVLATPAPEALDGWLEARIKTAMCDKKDQAEWLVKKYGLSASDTAKQDLAGLSISLLVEAIYDGRKDDPAKWLVEQVMKDATQRDAGHFEGGKLHKRFAWNETAQAKVEQEREAIMALVEQFQELQLDLDLALEREIRAGIKAREKPSGGGC